MLLCVCWRVCKFLPTSVSVFVREKEVSSSIVAHCYYFRKYKWDYSPVSCLSLILRSTLHHSLLFPSTLSLSDDDTIQQAFASRPPTPQASCLWLLLPRHRPYPSPDSSDFCGAWRSSSRLPVEPGRQACSSTRASAASSWRWNTAGYFQQYKSQKWGLKD